ncbi:hypothetical protein M9H77_13100 [Catharanthus roseus]|uniref:Uncharacterized protein n=1 Tax=Catharanthus roseus TaxID=4058 RepID=A0ACC0BJ93_CATRO|nr:hypothetical protein M9H77_13100 [Catharanthus roseus]
MSCAKALKGLEQHLSCLAKGVKDLRSEEEAILEQSNRGNLGGHPMCNDQWGYGVPRSDVRNGGNYVNIWMRVENHERQIQGQAKEKFRESPLGEMSTKENELSQAQDVIDRKVIHHEKKNTCTFVKEEKSREEKVKSVVSAKESEGKIKENLLVTTFSSSCAYMWSKIHIFFGSFVESGDDERVSCFPWSLYNDFHAKFKGDLVENCDYESIFLYAFMKNLDGFIPSIQLLSFVC